MDNSESNPTAWEPSFPWAEVIFNPKLFKLKVEQEFPRAPPPKPEGSDP